ncbi:MAG: hypothetical protein GW905_07945 [Rhodobacterales bacterium]|nr:hypothetical protein [Rhodobacterales bacterium]
MSEPIRKKPVVEVPLIIPAAKAAQTSRKRRIKQAITGCETPSSVPLSNTLAADSFDVTLAPSSFFDPRPEASLLAMLGLQARGIGVNSTVKTACQKYTKGLIPAMVDSTNFKVLPDQAQPTFTHISVRPSGIIGQASAT